MNLFKQYNIRGDLFDNQEIFDLANRQQELSTLTYVESALALMIPQPCGYQLVRIGGDGDGGYLLPHDFHGIGSCFSPGVSRSKSFEDEMLSAYGVKSFLCDFTSSEEKIETKLIQGKQFFEKKWLSPYPGKDNLTLSDWVEMNDDGCDLILQMDIEGDEYANLISLDETLLSRFRILVIEMHGLANLKYISFLKGILLPALNKIASNFVCVHAHPNNARSAELVCDHHLVPDVIELTFLRKDRVRKDLKNDIQLPNKLDQVNLQFKPPLHLSGVWLNYADRLASHANRVELNDRWVQEFGDIARNRLDHLQYRIRKLRRKISQSNTDF